jgi:hypothetical protein
MKSNQNISTRTWVYVDFWSGDHRPYCNVVRTVEDEEIGQMSNLSSLFQEAGLDDGDEFEITIRKTGNRPFGDRKVRLVEPHKYRREE